MRLLRSIALQILLVLLTIGTFEVFLRLADFRDLRIVPEAYRLPYDHDPELGWAPVPGKRTQDGGQLNSLGLRDIELSNDGRPRIIFVGDSLVYGTGVASEQRFSDLLRPRLPQFRVVNAGVAGYGTDQEYLWLRRLWPHVQPKIVVLIFSVGSDHWDNSTNVSYGHTPKPYLAQVDGQWQFRGIPVPPSHRWYYDNNIVARHSLVARLAINVHHHLRYPAMTVSDPTNRLISMMRDFAEQRGAKFVVGLQHDDPAVEEFLKRQMIPYTRFDGAATLPGDRDDHWSAEGHATVAERIQELLAKLDSVNTAEKSH